MIKITEIHIYNDTTLIKTADGDLEGIDPNNNYDFKGAIETNHIPLTKKLITAKRSKITKAIVRQVRDMAENVCTYCFADLSTADYHVDHIIPLSFGGSSKLSNLALACSDCNGRKSHKLFKDLAAIRAFLEL